MIKQHQTYKAKNGNVQFKPSNDLLEEMEINDQGFCLACGEVTDGVEPDARRYTCTHCGAPKVYGSTELVLMGLYYIAEE